MKNAAVWCIAGLFFLAGCGDGQSAPSAAYTTKAASLLKKYQVAQNINRMQSDGAYGSMKELIDRQLIEGELAKAYDKQSPPAAVGGYLFSDIEQDSDGRPIERRKKSGLCAYPESGNGEVILMLLDSNDPEEWAFYTGDAAATGGAVRRWPDLKDKFTRSNKYSPQEALKEAEKRAKEQ
jgi:hypothetical protein